MNRLLIDCLSPDWSRVIGSGSDRNGEIRYLLFCRQDKKGPRYCQRCRRISETRFILMLFTTDGYRP